MPASVINLAAIALGVVVIAAAALLPLDESTGNYLLTGGGIVFGYGIKRMGDVSRKDLEP